MQKFLNKLKIFLVLLFTFAIFLRAVYLLHNSFPFMYDHARDAIEVMHMIRTQSPRLIGPRASIEGLYFGPGWYYLIALPYAINSHPISPIFLMLGLLLLQMYLLYRYFGLTEAVIVATAETWIWISTSAWNPFVLPLISLIILIILKNLHRGGSICYKRATLLGLSAGMAFHFSSAYAIFYPVIIALVFWYKQLIFKNWQKVAVMIVVFGLTFLPQILFDLRHEFLQTKAVISYLTIEKPAEDALSVYKFDQVIKTTVKELKLAILPGVRSPWPVFNEVITAGILAIIGLGVVQLWIERRLGEFYLPLLFILIPTLAYLFLHFSVWYVLGMAPSMVIMAGTAVRSLPKYLKYSFLAVMIIASTSAIVMPAITQQPNYTGITFAARYQAVKFVRDTAGDRSFSSYHYFNDVYDFPYQYIYFWQATQGQTLPIEFSYQPNPVPYYPEKDELLASFPDEVKFMENQPELIFQILEKNALDKYFHEWTDAQIGISDSQEVNLVDGMKVIWGEAQ